MSHVELPRPLEAYFAHAEIAGTADSRRFTITLPYFDGERLDRLQWWWSVSLGQQRVSGEEGVTQSRREATQRFRQHIEHWLLNHGRVLAGEEPIPRLRRAAAADVSAPAAAPETEAPPVPLPALRTVTG
jgi:hypothetical protein